MHPEAYGFVREWRAILPLPDLVVEFGSRDINGTVRWLFPYSRYVGIDRAVGGRVDVIADATSFALQRPADLVICCEVLEHAPDAEQIVQNAGRLLRPFGTLLATMAAPPREPHSSIDGGPLRAGEFYRNVTSDDLLGWLCSAGLRARAIVCDELHGDLHCAVVKGVA